MKRLFSPAQRAVIYLIARGRCQICGCVLNPANWHADHIHPFSKAGETHLRNAQALCPPCNLTKSNTMNPLQFVPAGEKLHSWQIEFNEKREGGPWVEAAAELDRETKQGHGGDRSKVAGRHLGDVTKADTGTRDGIRRRLEKYAGDPAACSEKGTTTKRVKQALRDFLAGHPAQACVRAAGLASPNQDKGARIRINGPAHEVARRLIDHLGATDAAAIAAAITHLLTEQ